MKKFELNKQFPRYSDTIVKCSTFCWCSKTVGRVAAAESSKCQRTEKTVSKHLIYVPRFDNQEMWLRIMISFSSVSPKSIPTILEWQRVKLKSPGCKESIRKEVQDIQVGMWESQSRQHRHVNTFLWPFPGSKMNYRQLLLLRLPVDAQYLVLTACISHRPVNIDF